MIPYVRGKVTRQAHVDLPPGSSEEEYARGGFSGAYAHFYRQHAPVAWSRIEGPLRPRCFDLGELAGQPAADFDDYLAGRQPLLGNDDVVVSMARLTKPMAYFYRNADADELVFVHAGHGTLETEFGVLPYRRGDYLVIPRGTTQRLDPADVSTFLVIATRGELAEPERGLLGQHALYDPAVLEVPSPSADGVGSRLAGQSFAGSAPGAREWEVRIQRQGELTSVFYPFCPLDVLGWKGTLTVKRLAISDIRPVMSERYHLPPSAHSTFAADGVIVCTFLPRSLENGDPGALKVPFYHSNIDFDEVLFYHDGEFFSRTGVHPGMLTFHPQGIHHGPQPGAAERAKDAQRTNEVAVMIDTRRPLAVLAGAERHERADYWQSWGARAATAETNKERGQ